MKKNQTVQGTFSKLFGKKHANPPSTSLYATNPPWIFTQEAPDEGSRDFGKRARGGGPGGRRGAREARPGRNTLQPARRGAEALPGRGGGPARLSRERAGRAGVRERRQAPAARR